MTQETPSFACLVHSAQKVMDRRTSWTSWTALRRLRNKCGSCTEGPWPDLCDLKISLYTAGNQGMRCSSKGKVQRDLLIVSF